MKSFFIKLASSSVLWGLVATFLFYFGINTGAIRNETIVRYSTGHPVEYATIAMFWVGVLDLLLKTAFTKRERRALKRGVLFPPKKREREPISNVDLYLETVAKAREVRGDSTYLTRLFDALNFLKFGGSPDDLDQELRCLADDAYESRDSEYGMARTFIWAIPILGFLGTVLGITVALGSLDLTQLETTGETLAAGLKVAFDTTALALSLVFVVYFLQFFSRKQDAALASQVARLVDVELKGRFLPDSNVGVASAELETTRRFLQSVAGAFEDATKAQTALWTETMTEAARSSAEMMRESVVAVGETIDRRMTGGAAEWANALAETQREFVENALRPILAETVARVAKIDALEARIAEQAEALRGVLEASADVVAIEERLTGTLEKIAEVGEFEKTLNNLSATVCLLNSKLTSVPTVANYSDTVRFDANFARRSSKRSEALAALESLENSLESSLESSFDHNASDASQSLNFQHVVARAEEVASEPIVSSLSAFQDEEESVVKRTTHKRKTA